MKPTITQSSAPLLSAQQLSKRWGGLLAVDNVSIDLYRNQVHAVIGTNGAGKSTLINLLSGEFAPTSGTIHLLGHNISQLSQPKRANLGLGRSYQRNTVFNNFSVYENCRLSAQGKFQKPWQIWQSATSCQKSCEMADKAIALTGLESLTQRPAGLLSHGQKRQLEMAMCLATGPEVLLFDEPLAGMGAEETERMLALLANLRTQYAILLVEHDMDAVFRIADVITVMVNGAVIASGSPTAVRENEMVQAAYLGEHA